LVIHVFVQASDIGGEGGILADAIESHLTLLARLDSTRRQASMAMGISKDEASATGSISKTSIVSSPHAHSLLPGEQVGEGFCDLVVRSISVGQPHRAVPIIVAMALAAASKLSGSVLFKNTAKQAVDPEGVTLSHNSGRILVGANFNEDGSVENATVFRTVRRIMNGMIYWK